MSNTTDMKKATKPVKCLINSIDDAVTESLSGFCYTYPQLEYQASHKVVLAPNLERRKDKVSVICGGGSGHEPFVAGFVGSGMLSASIAGSIFAAPPSIHISYAIQRVSEYSKAGVLVVVPNYTGDCLNFGIAIQKARQAGLQIADIIVDEDCSIPKEEQGVAGKRGLTGMLFIIKIAGALAEKGLPLPAIMTIIQDALKNMATYAVGLTACAIPGQGLMFELADDEIECGMGIHGEAGYEKIKICSAGDVVTYMLKHICTSLRLIPGDFVAVIINNFGSLSQLEQGIVVHEVVNQLRAMDIQVLRVYSGALVTSLSSAGIHITILKLPEDQKALFISCLDDPTNAPRWPGCAYSVPIISKEPTDETEVKPIIEKMGIEMNRREQQLLKCCLKNACAAIMENETRLNDLDSGCGDGDCGTTLKRFGSGIMENINSFHLSHPSSVLSEMANIAEERLGGTSGALYCLFLTAAAQELVTAERKDGWLHIWGRVFRSSLNCLMKYGKAKPGDRTMIDALDAACLAYENMVIKHDADIYQSVVAAVWKGCEDTKKMKPRAGRASYVKQAQYLQDVDAGAYAVATWITAIVEAITNFKE